MMYKTHMNFGILFSIFTILFFYHKDWTIFIFISAFAALIPDMDHKNSFISNKLSITITIIIISLLMITYNKYVLLFSLIWCILAKISIHRTFTHSILGLILFCIPFLTSDLLIPVFIGYCSHLISDMFTVEGITIFYPFNKNRFGIKFIKVGSTIEFVLLNLLIFTNTMLVIYLLIKLL